MSTLEGSLRIISNGNVILYLMRGTLFTILVSAISIVISLLIGSVLALLRSYARGGASFLRVLSTCYITETSKVM